MNKNIFLSLIVLLLTGGLLFAVESGQGKVDPKGKVPATKTDLKGKDQSPKPEPKGKGQFRNGTARDQANFKPGAGNREPVKGGKFSPDANRFHHFRDMSAMQQTDPELYKLVSADADLDREIKDLARQYKKSTDDKQKKELRKKVADLCAEHFEIRQKRRELELNRMKAWLASLEEGVKKSRENSSKIIEMRVNNLLDNNLGEF